MSEEKQETIADIIAEKRKCIEEIRCNLSTVPIRREEQLAEIDRIEFEASRLEAAWNREKAEADPNWKEICEKCHDGDMPEHCEYFGEPNGCNSPIYGEHPKAEQCNAAEKREKLPMWENGTDYEYEYAYCSECGRMVFANWYSHAEAREKVVNFHEEYKYCPGCGAKIEGGVYVQ